MLHLYNLCALNFNNRQGTERYLHENHINASIDVSIDTFI